MKHVVKHNLSRPERGCRAAHAVSRDEKRASERRHLADVDYVVDDGEKGETGRRVDAEF